MATLRITYRRSTIGSNARQKATVRSLGLRKLNHTVELPDRPEVRGMLKSVRHLISVEEVPDAPATEEETSR
jgi:large subunit ribosomal protein L30